MHLRASVARGKCAGTWMAIRSMEGFLGTAARGLHVPSATPGRPRPVLRGLVKDSTERATVHRFTAGKHQRNGQVGTCPTITP